MFRAYGILCALLPVAGCTLLEPDLVSVDPEWGYLEGCTDVVLQGSRLGTTATAAINGRSLEALKPAEYDDSLPEHAQDVGFKYTGVTPPAGEGITGYVDVTMKVDDEGEPKELRLYKGFYYLTCPASVHVDHFGQTEDGLAFEGCNMADDLSVQIFEYIPAVRDEEGNITSPERVGAQIGSSPLASECSTAKTSTVLPTLPAGEYTFALTDSDARRWPLECTPVEGEAPCPSLPTFDIGGDE